MFINNNLQNTLKAIFGLQIEEYPLPGEELEKLPIFLSNIFSFRGANVLGRELVFAVAKDGIGITVGRLEKQFVMLEKVLGKQPVLVVDVLQSTMRARLVEKRINFIVPTRQVFLPALLLDLRDQKTPVPRARKTLRPSTQVLFLYLLLNPEQSGRKTLQTFANTIGYSPMTITLAAAELQMNNLVHVRGTRTRTVELAGSGREVWDKALPLLINPVAKRLYVDQLPVHEDLRKTNIPALAEYSNLDAGRQEYYAVAQSEFPRLWGGSRSANFDSEEGKYCIELWLYEPKRLVNHRTAQGCVDPLSLYISLRETSDERVEMALEQMVQRIL